jgi:hypothetical protein
LISPPPPGEPYPGRLPPVRTQWLRLALWLRVVLVVVPLVLVVAVLLLDVAAGLTALVFAAGAAAATVVYAKNRTDRHNAAVDRGDIKVAADPHFRAARPEELGEGDWVRLARLGFDRGVVGRIERFDGGWLVRRRNPRDVAAVVGDDGDWAQFDPKAVSDLWAATEYLAGRGHEDPA